MNEISNSISGDILLSKFKPERQERILAIKDSLHLDTDKDIMSVGSDVAREINELNKNVLSTIKVKDIPEVEQILPQLTAAFQEVDSSSLIQKKRGIFSKLFGGNQVQEFVQRFENAESVVYSIQTNLERVEMELRKDIELEDSLGRKNLQYITDLENTIVALRLRLNDLLLEISDKEKELKGDSFVDAQLLEEEKDKAESIEKQIFWLEQQKLLAIQTLPLLRNLRNTNKDMVRQINLTVTQSIPAWEQGIIIAFHIHRQQGALRIERAVHDMTNQIVRQNSQLLKENAVEVAKAVESGMIDMDTFREANNNIIETSKQLARIKSEALEKRQESIAEYTDIAQKLIEVEKRDMKKLVDAKDGELHV